MVSTQYTKHKQFQHFISFKLVAYCLLAISVIGVLTDNIKLSNFPLVFLILILSLCNDKKYETTISRWFNKQSNQEILTNPSIISASSERGRVAIFVDGENLYFSAKEEGMTVSYPKLLKELTKKASQVVSVYYYTSLNPANRNHQKFLQTLQSMGYEIMPNEFEDKNRDSAIIVDMIRFCELFDTLVLVSGDGDFCTPIKFLKEFDRKVEVVSFPANTNKNLRKLATDYINILCLPGVCQKTEP